MERIVFICSVCRQYKGKDYRKVLQHMKTHRFDPNLFIKRGINSCPEKYTNYELF